jgi:hypothetical protein
MRWLNTSGLLLPLRRDIFLFILATNLRFMLHYEANGNWMFHLLCCSPSLHLEFLDKMSPIHSFKRLLVYHSVCVCSALFSSKLILFMPQNFLRLIFEWRLEKKHSYLLQRAGGEMTQTTYAHMNKWVKKKKEQLKEAKVVIKRPHLLGSTLWI